ncbi:MAG: DUF1254 domain-containing protein [Myxococcales bacterium]
MSQQDFSRRNFLIGSSLVGASTLLPFATARADSSAGSSLEQIAEDAFIWGIPPVLLSRYIQIARDAGVPFNRFQLSLDLATPQTRAVGPNVDTLYGFAWLDLDAAPQVIAVPDTNDRYYSIQLLDLYGNSFAYIGRRTTGTKAGAFALTPPGYWGRIPRGVTQIKAPTSKVLALVRTLVRGHADLEASRAVHQSYTLGALSQYPHGRVASEPRTESLNVFPALDLSGEGASYFDELNGLIREYPPLPSEWWALFRLARVGIGPGRKIRNDDLRALLASAVAPGLARVKQGLASAATVVNGWRVNQEVVPFITDPVLRAGSVLYGPGFHVRDEALYFSANNLAGAPLSGQNRYRLRFPAGQLPPVGAFWSLTLYGANFFLVDNPINRYAIHDRTEGLTYGADGSLEIQIQNAPPAEGTSNWLPAPQGAFSLTLRTYQPSAAILDGDYQLPPLALA